MPALYRPLSFVAVFGILTAAGMLFQELGAGAGTSPDAVISSAEQAYSAQTLRTVLLWMLVLIGMYRLLRYCLRRSPVTFFTRQEANTAERAFRFEIKKCRTCGQRRYAMMPSGSRKMIPVIPGAEIRWADIRWYCPHCRNQVGEDACTPTIVKRIRPTAEICGAVRKSYGVRRSIILQSLVIALVMQVLFLISLRFLSPRPLPVLFGLLALYLMINYLLLFIDTALMRFTICEKALVRRGLYDTQTHLWTDFDFSEQYGERTCFFTQSGNFFIPSAIDGCEELEKELREK